MTAALLLNIQRTIPDLEEATHTYRVRGIVKPGVTQVLESQGIVDYSYLPPAIRKGALKRGRNVHLATRYDDEGDLLESTVTEEVSPYLLAWRRFRREMEFIPQLIEYRGYHPQYGYAGTLDRTGLLKGKLVLLDIKTNTAELWVALQLAAYAAFFQDPRTLQRLCVELHADGTYSLAFTDQLASRKWFDQFQDFVSCVSAYNVRRHYGQRRLPI